MIFNFFGSNNFGQSGIGDNKFINEIKKIEYFNNLNLKIIKINCSEESSIILTGFKIIFSKYFYLNYFFKIENEVLSVGCNFNGELGIGEEKNDTKVHKIEFLKNKKIIDITSGQFHSLAISKDGDIYSWGYNAHGQLGNGNNKNQFIPIKIFTIKN
jgi:hypothetical protein